MVGEGVASGGVGGVMVGERVAIADAAAVGVRIEGAGGVTVGVGESVAGEGDGMERASRSRGGV